MDVHCPNEAYVLELHELGYSSAAIAREMEWPAAMVDDCLSRHIDGHSASLASGDPVETGTILLGEAVRQAGGHV